LRFPKGEGSLQVGRGGGNREVNFWRGSRRSVTKSTLRKKIKKLNHWGGRQNIHGFKGKHPSLRRKFGRRGAILGFNHPRERVAGFHDRKLLFERLTKDHPLASGGGGVSGRTRGKRDGHWLPENGKEKKRRRPPNWFREKFSPEWWEQGKTDQKGHRKAPGCRGSW